ncbi:hypothetical protein ABZ705_24175, partial [Streptomyces sp. NPDC006984]|uniref:hypothetical protein n=1 Tax=Streptomyces sp. NPDC006984 TaxID=3155463 RepID=UPI0033ED392B
MAMSSAASGRDQELLLMVVEVRGNLSPVRPGLDRCRPPAYPAWITAGSTWWMPGRDRVSAPSSEVVIKVTVVLLLLAQTARAESVEDLIVVQAAWTRPPVRPSEPDQDVLDMITSWPPIGRLREKAVTSGGVVPSRPGSHCVSLAVTS